jgi:hypothetical protein
VNLLSAPKVSYLNAGSNMMFHYMHTMHVDHHPQCDLTCSSCAQVRLSRTAATHGRQGGLAAVMTNVIIGALAYGTRESAVRCAALRLPCPSRPSCRVLTRCTPARYRCGPSCIHLRIHQWTSPTSRLLRAALIYQAWQTMVRPAATLPRVRAVCCHAACVP